MSDMAEKVAAAREDLCRLKDGWRPSQADLSDSVLLNEWLLTTGSSGLPVLMGNAVDHPLLGSQLITTSPLLWVDDDQTIARTLSRWYRLGPPPDSTASEPSLPASEP